MRPAASTRQGSRVVNDRTAGWTESARDALRRAVTEARGRNHNYVGQEHLLLGLLQVEEGAAVAILRELNIPFDAIQTEVELITGRPALPPTDQPFTPPLDAALDLAADEAAGFDHPAVATDHLLLGIIREGQGLGADIVRARGVTLSIARDRALTLRAAGFSER
jgi:ATP-dependent Clp protease ATP-binding subunit ClpC